MIINVLLMILALGIGLGTNQPIKGSSATTESNLTAVDQCYMNGKWYNPCPASGNSDPDPPGSGNTPGGQSYQ